MRKCQFCVTNDAEVTFLCAPFELPQQGEFARYVDTGTWPTCKQCADLIDNAPRDALIATCEILAATHIPGGDDPIFVAAMKRVLNSFFDNRIGDALPLGLDLPESPHDHPFGSDNHPSRHRPFDQGDL